VGSEPESAEVEYNPAQPSSSAQSAVALVLARHADELMAIDGVEGTGVGRNDVGNDAIVVYLRDASVRSRVPSEIEGHPVETSVTGVIDAF
jgi:hypothetical protein